MVYRLKAKTDFQSITFLSFDFITEINFEAVCYFLKPCTYQFSATAFTKYILLVYSARLTAKTVCRGSSGEHKYLFVQWFLRNRFSRSWWHGTMSILFNCPLRFPLPLFLLYLFLKFFYIFGKISCFFEMSFVINPFYSFYFSIKRRRTNLEQRLALEKVSTLDR